MKSNSFGFSLLESLVSGAILAASALLVFQFFASNRQTQKLDSAQLEFLHTARLARNIVNLNSSCTSALKGLVFKKDTATQLNGLRVDAKDLVRITFTQKSGTNITKLELNSIGEPLVIADPPDMPAGNYSLYTVLLTIEAQRIKLSKDKTPHLVGGPLVQKIAFKAYTSNANDRIVNCGPLEIGNEQLACLELGGLYNPLSRPRCKVGDWRSCHEEFQGTTTNGPLSAKIYQLEALCPAGEKAVSGVGYCSSQFSGGDSIPKMTSFYPLFPSKEGYRISCLVRVPSTLNLGMLVKINCCR